MRVHVIKLTFPKDIGRLSQDGSIKTEMGLGSMGHIIGVLRPGMLVSEVQHGSIMAR